MDTRTQRIAAISNHHIEAVKIFLGAGALVDNADVDGRGPLWRVESGSIAKILLEHGADPNKADKYGKTPLHSAAYIGKRVLIKSLIEEGADIGRRDKQGRSPLEVTRECGHENTFKRILAQLGLE